MRSFWGFYGRNIKSNFCVFIVYLFINAIVLQNTEPKETRKEFTRLANANEQQLSLISNQQQKDDTYKVIQKVTIHKTAHLL